ncbi:hypothetical protein CK556_01650 [Mesoplasma chauliocola]|uniref:Lipoprotein n=1 Tax=Mesoplasma chauliocola TaxID=216427 RepID=A0A249SN60_9MOLU|nr:hypothetical protein [Mesoplasma chauliocola]ASZ09060.1 hypothetical protein CK556_01650 [Mesoplasma chauliocola]
MLKKILPIVSAFVLGFGLVSTACSKKPIVIEQEYKPFYNYYVLGDSFEKEVEAKFHEALAEKQNAIIYIDNQMQNNMSFTFFNQDNLEEINKRKQNESLPSNYDLLSQREKEALDNDLNKIIKTSQIEKTILNSMSHKLTFYETILKFKNDEFWFKGISYDFNNIDFGYLSLDKENLNYIANISFDLVFNYQYTDIDENLIKNKYKEEIVITITNQDSIIEDLKFLTNDLRKNLIKDRFEWAWFDAYDLRIYDYAEIFSLSNSDFENIFRFDKFEKSFINYILKNNPNTETTNKSYKFAFKNDERFKNFKSIDKIENFNPDQSKKYGAKQLILNDTYESDNKFNTDLFKSIFGELINDDQIILENKLVKGNKEIYKFLSEEYLNWLNEFQTRFAQNLGINSDSVVNYGEITLDNFCLYFEEFNYYHPVNPISYYTAISVNNLNDSYLREEELENKKMPLKVEEDPIFKAIYQNTINAVKIFQEDYGTKKITWNLLSDSKQLISLKNLTNYSNLKNFSSISDVNAELSLLNQNFNTLGKSERDYFLNKTNSSSFHFEFNNSEELENIPIIEMNNNQIIFKKFKDQASYISVDFNLSFLNLNFVIKSDKFYWFERTLIESN